MNGKIKIHLMLYVCLYIKKKKQNKIFTLLNWSSLACWSKRWANNNIYNIIKNLQLHDIMSSESHQQYLNNFTKFEYLKQTYSTAASLIG